MDFGLILLIRNPQQFRRPEHTVYQGYVDNSAVGEKLGFKHIWTSEHHFTPDGWSPAQLPVLAAVAQRTEQIRLGTMVFLLPLHNPIRVAEDVATVDIISNGRFDFGVGPGSHPGEFATFNVPFKQRRPRMFEGLEIIRKCFTEEEFSFKGKFYEFNQVRMTTKPVQKNLPIWIGAIGDKALAEAGTNGYHLAAAPDNDHVPIYETALRKAGYDPAKFQRAPLHITYVADTRDKAWDDVEGQIHYYMTWHFGMVKEQLGLTPGSVNTGMDLSIPPVGELRKTGRGPYGPAFVGTPEDIIKMIEAELKTRPVTEWVASLGVPGIDPALARRSIELFAKEVIPHFKNK